MVRAECGAVLAAARALILAGRWEVADRLLAGVMAGEAVGRGAGETAGEAAGRAAGEAAGRAELALLRAQIAVEIRQWRGRGDPAPAIDAAADQIGALGSGARGSADPGTGDPGTGEPGTAFDLELLRLFSDYWGEMMPSDGTAAHFGPAGREPAVLDGLRDRAARLVAVAPDRRRAARAAFYAGLVADNLRGEPDRARELFTRALEACRPGDDDDVAAEALRHLGGQAQDAGDLRLARRQWERSAELAQRAGWLPLALAQQVLLAELTAAEGDKAGAAVLAGEVRRWAAALGLGRLGAQAAAVGSGS